MQPEVVAEKWLKMKANDNKPKEDVIRTPAIEVGNSIYTGKDHGEAIKNAQINGEDTQDVNRERDGEFITKQGRIIDRKQAKKEFGLRHSHEIGMDRKFILVTHGFWGLGFAIQEQRMNGTEVIVAYKPIEEKTGDENEQYDLQGEGFVNKVPLDEIMAKREEYRDWYWVFDANKNTDSGEILREEGFKVWGGSEFQKMLEDDREFGLEFAESCGLHSPEHKDFSSVEEGIAFLEQNEDKAYVYKPNAQEESHLTTVLDTEEPYNNNLEMREIIRSLGINDFILQEKVKGVEVNVECFYQNGEPLFCQANIESKKNHNGDLGYATGCSFDICWEISLDSKLVEKTVKLFYPKLNAMQYTGFADCNVIIGDDQIYFLEFCFRNGYNAHCNLFHTISQKTYLQTVADLIDGVFEPHMKKGFGSSITLFTEKPSKGLPIYIPEGHEKEVYIYTGYFEDGMHKMTGGDEEIVIATAHNYTIQTSFQDAIKLADKIKFPNRYYRTDPDKTDFPSSPTRRFEALAAMDLLD